MGQFEGSRGSLQFSPTCINSSTPVFVNTTSCLRAKMNFFLLLIHLEEIPEFLLLLKFDLFTTPSEHINFVFHLGRYWCRHSYRQIGQSLYIFLFMPPAEPSVAGGQMAALSEFYLVIVLRDHMRSQACTELAHDALTRCKLSPLGRNTFSI